MSRDWEGDDYSDYWALNMGRWNSWMRHCFGSKKGVKYLTEFKEALEAMPDKRLIEGSLAEPMFVSIEPYDQENTSKEIAGVCAIGAYALYKGIDPEILLDDNESANASVEIGRNYGMTTPVAWAIGECNDSRKNLTPEQRWEFVHEWVSQVLISGRYIDHWNMNFVPSK